MVGWFNLMLVGAVSYTSAAVSMEVLQQRLEANIPPPQITGPPKEEKGGKERLAKASFQTILDTNMFKARRSKNEAATPAARTGAQDSGAAANGPLPGDLKLTLTGTMIVGKRSFATVADANGRNEKVYRLQECLPGGENHPSKECEPTQGKLMDVSKDRIEVEYQSRRLTIILAENPPTPPQDVARRRPIVRLPARPVPSTAPQGGAPFPMTRDGNVVEVRVPNAEVSKAFENFSEVLKQARVVPFNSPDGTGFQIRSIRPGSIFQRLGMNNFDVIEAVNGEPITTADQALRLLTMFRNEKEITLDLKRRNEDLKLNYIIE